MKSKGQRHLYALDLGAALALTAVYAGFARLTSDDGQPAYTGPPWLGCVIAAAVGLPIAVRRRWPLAVLAAVLAALATASLLDIPREPYAAAGLAAYLVGLAEPARRSVPALAVTLPVACGAVYLGEAAITPGEDWRGALGPGSWPPTGVKGNADRTDASHRSPGACASTMPRDQQVLPPVCSIRSAGSGRCSAVQVMRGGTTRAHRAPPRASVKPRRPTSSPVPAAASSTSAGTASSMSLARRNIVKVPESSTVPHDR